MKEKQAELEGLESLEKCYIEALKHHQEGVKYWQKAISIIIDAQMKKRIETARDVVKRPTCRELEALTFVCHLARIYFHPHVEAGGCLMGYSETGAYSLLQVAEKFIKELQERKEK